MNPYIALLTVNNEFEVVDTRDEIDYSRYIASTTSTWKKLLTVGQRNWGTHTNLFDNNTYVLTYEKGKIAIVNPSKGDYIPPGYLRVSRPIEGIFSGYDGNKCVSRSRTVPLDDNYILNPTFNSHRSSFLIYRNNSENGIVHNWLLANTGTDSPYYTYMTYSSELGIKCRDDGGNILALQTLRFENIGGKTRIRIRCTGATIVVLNTTVLDREDDDIWVWEGDPILADTPLSVGIGSENYVNMVEVLVD